MCETNTDVTPPATSDVDARETLLREELVAHAEDLVDEQDVGFHIEGEREGEARVHAG